MYPFLIWLPLMFMQEVNKFQHICTMGVGVLTLRSLLSTVYGLHLHVLAEFIDCVYKKI